MPSKLLDLVWNWEGGGRKARGIGVTFRNYVFDIPSLKQKGVEKVSKTSFLTWKTKA